MTGSHPGQPSLSSLAPTATAPLYGGDGLPMEIGEFQNGGHAQRLLGSEACKRQLPCRPVLLGALGLGRLVGYLLLLLPGRVPLVARLLGGEVAGDAPGPVRVAQRHRSWAIMSSCFLCW